MTVWTSTQGAFPARGATASVLDIPESRVKVVPTEIGGGFGGKVPIYLEPLAALLAKKSGRPVKIVMDRRSVFDSTGPTPGGNVLIKLGVNDKGLITAATADIRYESGAYPFTLPAHAAANCVFACYKIENLRIDGYNVIVNKSRVAAYRAPGSTQVAFAMESVVDELCEKLGIDPIEFRLMNGSKEGDRRAVGPLYQRVGNLEVLQAAQASPHWKSVLERKGPNGRVRGRGFASGYWMNIGLRSAVTISVNSDGTVTLVEGSTDIGGTRTSIAMQAAEVLGIPAEDVQPTVVDTDSIGITDITAGSRTTYATGWAACVAAESVVAEMTRRAATLWQTEPDNVECEAGVYTSKTDPELRLTFKELAGKLWGTGGPVSATGTVSPPGSDGNFGAHIVDLEVDPETGKVDILRYTAVQDAGRAIHPSYVEGQLQGGAVQGIGWALNEEYYMSDDCVMENSTFLDYRMPISLDLPMIETVIVEVPSPHHPFGVRGAGETCITPGVGAISNAIYDAIGVRLREAPMKPGRILEALAAAKQAS